MRGRGRAQRSGVGPSDCMDTDGPENCWVDMQGLGLTRMRAIVSAGLVGLGRFGEWRGEQHEQL